MCDKSSQDDDDGRAENGLLIPGIKIAAGFWIGNLVLAAFCWAIGASEKFGQFGDSFGFVNALFSSVAVAGAVYAVILQQRELALTRKEMRQATAAHKSSAEAQARMTTIQGLTALIADQTQDIAYYRTKRDALVPLRQELQGFIRKNQGLIDQRLLPEELHGKALKLFSDGERLAGWNPKIYPPKGIHRALADDIVKLGSVIEAEFTRINAKISGFQKTKATNSEKLTAAFAENKTADAG